MVLVTVNIGNLLMADDVVLLQHGFDNSMQAQLRLLLQQSSQQACCIACGIELAICFTTGIFLIFCW
jgi:hypothetical protein